MQLTQILLFAVVGILTILLVAVGVQVMIILVQAHKTIKKLNNFLEDANVISSSVARPVAGVASFLEGLKNMKSLVEIVADKQTKSTRHTAHVSSHTPQSATAMETIKAVLDKTPIAPIVEELIEDVIASPKQIQQHTHIQAIQERGRRFFHKGGKPLTS